MPLILFPESNHEREDDLKRLQKPFLDYLPKSLENSFLSMSFLELKKRPISRFKKSFLPFLFKMNVQGGWITSDANWYLESLTHDRDLQVRRRLTNFDPFKNLRARAYNEGWVRVDWDQPIFDGKFSTSNTQPKYLSFTFEPKTLQNQKMFWAIEQIATLYSIIITKPFYLKINKVINIDNNSYKIQSKSFNELSFFLLDLQTIKYRGN